MDASFDLKSSMSPRFVKKLKTVNKKPPSRLALKKYFRRSSLLPVTNTFKNNESIIIIESSSSETGSSSSRSSKETPVVISDSELSFNIKQSTTPGSEVKSKDCDLKNKPKSNTFNMAQLTEEKYKTIKQWLNEIDNTEQDTSGFSEVSAIPADENCYRKNPKLTKVAASSTLIEPGSKRFDELFINHRKPRGQHLNTSNKANQDCKNNIKGKSRSEMDYIPKKLTTEIDDSLITEDNSKEDDGNIKNLEDSFSGLILNESLNTRLNKKQIQENNKKSDSSVDHLEVENLLDNIYGNSWREKQEDILPSSEPRLKKAEKKITKAKPKTERPAKVTRVYENPYVDKENNSNNLLQTLQRERFKRALESPWIKSLKNLCDSDTDSADDSINNLAPIKLDFKDQENDDENQKCNNKIVTSGSSENSSKGKTQIDTKKNNKNKPKKATPIVNNEVSKSQTGCYSFLASLSKNVPMSKSDMSAWIYRNSFKENREQLTAKLFKLYNESIFDNGIPADTPLEWNDRMRGTAGYCYCRKITRSTGAIERKARIVLSTKVLDSPDRLRDTLVHEMCHAATWIVNQIADGHGSFWKSWADRAMKVFPELPPIKRCHQYVINTKYTYKCTGCGYSIGRHSKSLDTERKRCGYCYGKFEVFINKTTKSGETKSVPVTPRKQTGFALFVKENYATYKAPDLKHADVMKILGQKFSALKCDQS